MRTDRPSAPTRQGLAGGAAGVAVALVVLAVIVPVAAVAVRAVRPDDTWTLDAAARILGSDRTWRLAAATVLQAAGSSVLTLAVGLPLAWVLARYRFPGRGVVRTFAMVPFVLPSVVLATAVGTILGPAGIVDLRGTWWPVLAAHVCFNLAVIVRIVGAALEDLDPSMEDVARTLGCSPAAAARRVLLPAVAPAVAAAAVVVFLFCLTSFGVIVILGGGAVSTIEVEIWVRATSQFDLSGAAVLGMVQLGAVVATLAVHAHFSRRSHRPRRRSRSWARSPETTTERGQVLAAVAAVGLIAVVPLAALAERSLRMPDGGHGLDHWRHLGSVTSGTSLAVSPLDAVAVSVVSSLVATALALVIGVPAARVAARRPGGVADRLLLLPLGVSATTVGLGMLLAFGRPPVDLRRSWWLVPAAQALVAVPLVVRTVATALRELPPGLSDAAATLGAGPLRRWWRVELPMVRPAVVAGGGLALVASLGEFGATVFLARVSRPTVPVAIERLLSRPGAAGVGQAMALSCMLVALCGVVLLITDRAGSTGRM